MQIISSHVSTKEMVAWLLLKSSVVVVSSRSESELLTVPYNTGCPVYDNEMVRFILSAYGSSFIFCCLKSTFILDEFVFKSETCVTTGNNPVQVIHSNIGCVVCIE